MKTLRLSIILAALMLMSLVSSASHFKGGDTYFKCVGGGYYQLVFKCYYSCEAGSSLPYPASSITFSVSSSCGSIPGFLTCDSATTPVNVPDYCPGVLTTCDYNYSGGGAPAGTPDGTLVVEYSTPQFLIPAGCTVYASIDQGSRNAAITNLVNPSSYDIYVSTMITVPASGGCGSSPASVSTPVSIVSLNRPATISYQILSPGTDSIIYHLVSARSTSNVAIPYVTGCDSLNPMGVGSGSAYASSFALDRHTGVVSLVPTASGNYVIAIGADAYKNGANTGSVQRDCQLRVVASAVNNNPPALISKFTAGNVSGGTVIDSTTIAACAGTVIQIDLKATDPDSGNYLYDSTDATSVLSGATVATTHRGTAFDTATLHISWTPLGSDTGYHTFMVSVRDSSCPRPGIARYSFVINVVGGVNAGADQVHCIGGQSTVITATGSGHYHWTNVTGGTPSGVLSYSADSSTIAVAPSATSSYVVTSGVSGQCRNKDTVTVTNAALFSLISGAQNPVICKYTSTILTTAASPSALGPFTYSWTPSVATPAAAATSTGAVLASTLYYVNVTSAAGCQVHDSVRVTVSGAVPHISLSTSANNVCTGDTVTLNAAVAFENVVQTGLVDTCPNNSSLINAKCYSRYDTLTTLNNGTPFNAIYSSQRVQYLFHPAELYAAGMSSGSITDISFFVNAVNSTSGYDSFYVSVGPTTVDSLSDFVNGLYGVTNYASFYPNVGWNPIAFTHFYKWDGASNIVVQLCYTLSTNTSNSDQVAASSLISPGSTFYQSSFSGANGCTLPGAGGYSASIKPAVRFGMCLPQVSAHYLWTPHTLVSDTILSTRAVINSSHAFTFTATTPGGCSSRDSISVNLSPYLNAPGSQVTLCHGDTAHLSAFNSSYQGQCIQDYTVTSIPYAPLSGTGTTIPNASFVDANGFGNTDDGSAGPINLPFAFPFYCGSQSQLWVNTNGWMSFVNPNLNSLGSQSYIAQTFPPTSTNLNPQKMIALLVGDYALSNAGGNINYFTTGTAPARTFVVKVNALPSLASTTVTTTGQVQLHESDGSIDILLTSSNYTSASHTTGIKDSTGIGIAAPGRNNIQYTVTIPEAWHFAPVNVLPTVQSILWTPNSFLSSNTAANPSAYPPTTQRYVANANVLLNPATSSTVCHIRDTVTVNVDQFNHTLTANRLQVCNGDTTQLHFNTTNTLDSIIWSPATGLSSAYVSAPVDTARGSVIYMVNAKDVAGCRVTDSIRITAVNLSVWPGDANDDHTADNTDILYIGLAYGDTGTARANGSIAWSSQCANEWDSTFVNGVNCAHADCNGDGIVNYADTAAVSTNWGLTHAKTNAGRTSNYDITIQTDKAQYDIHDTVTAHISIGDASNVMPHIYGVAYELGYTSHGVTHILGVNQSVSWLNRKLDFSKVTAPTTAYLAQSRIDHRDTSGYGVIAEAKFLIDGGISLADSGYITVSNVIALDKNGDTVYINPGTKTIAINSAGVGIPSITQEQLIEIYPNPNKGVFSVTSTASGEVSIVLTDAIGREVYTKTLTSKLSNIDLTNLPEGIYTANFSSVSGRSSKRVVIV